MTKPFRGALVGQHIGYSLSSEIFERMFEMLDIDGSFEVFDVGPDELDGMIGRLRQLDGYSVTVPYKEKIIGHLNRMDAVATAIGAVNSVSCDEGKMTGYNTDWRGFLYPLRDKIEAEDRILIIGNGGAARAVAWALLTSFPSIRVTIAGRSLEKSQQLAEHLTRLDAAYKTRTDTMRVESLDEIQADIVVNCTPVGGTASPEESPLLAACDISGLRIAYDLGYVPETTGFLRHMSESGCETINGLSMLAYQAAASLAVWRRIALNIEEVAKAVLTDANGVNRC